MFALQPVGAVFCSLKNAKLYRQEPRCMLCKLWELFFVHWRSQNFTARNPDVCYANCASCFLFTEERKTLPPGTQVCKAYIWVPGGKVLRSSMNKKQLPQVAKQTSGFLAVKFCVLQWTKNSSHSLQSIHLGSWRQSFAFFSEQKTARTVCIAYIWVPGGKVLRSSVNKKQLPQFAKHTSGFPRSLKRS